MPVPLAETDDPLNFLRYLAAEICDALMIMSDPDASTAQVEDACDRLHFFATELSLLTVDVRKGAN
jgi:hypothetical protein